MTRLYLVTMSTPHVPESPIGEIRYSAVAANRDLDRVHALAQAMGREATVTLYARDMKWWEDRTPVRLYLWKKVRRNRDKHRVRACFSHAASVEPPRVPGWHLR